MGVSRELEIEYGLPKSIHEVCPAGEIHSDGERHSATLDLDRAPMDTEDSMGKHPKSRCDNSDVGGKPILEEGAPNLNAKDELSVANNGDSETPARCVAPYGFLKLWDYILGRCVVFRMSFIATVI